MIFVSFAEERPADVSVELTGTELDVYELGNAKVATARDGIVKANWKVLWENGLECYHCALNHPELGAVVDFKRAGPLITHVEMNEFDFRPEFPILSSSATITADGQLASSRLMGDINNPPSSVAFLSWHTAQFELIASPDHVHIMTYVPISVDTTLVRTVLLINAEADEVSDVDVDKLFELHAVTRGQDNDLCEKVQRGIANETFEPGPYNFDYEFANQNFVRLYRAVMDEA
jgi:Rieske 2Fe-2S family protein